MTYAQPGKEEGAVEGKRGGNEEISIRTPPVAGTVWTCIIAHRLINRNHTNVYT